MVNRSGSATVAFSTIVELEQGPLDTRHMFLVATLGNCYAFRFSRQSSKGRSYLCRDKKKISILSANMSRNETRETLFSQRFCEIILGKLHMKLTNFDFFVGIFSERTRGK